ncbi:short chain dehydrogenase/reductase family protein-like protein [Microthyrium microscopicum]|uniref:Short chain dehydrogenase/reductase family protein-like protein n=1 Tax=Microthyrium microscopicum TaxID=703497 RepID=A0A6A6UJY5_9PEZI|nr:short chain dehydrogenase/reductase family protein-like protein [Microthyrium microscopicum]
MSQDPPSPTDNAPPSFTRGPDFPASRDPRVWLLTDGLSPVALALTRRLLEHGDFVIAGVLPEEYAGTRGEAFRNLEDELAADAQPRESAEPSGIEKTRRDRLKSLDLDGKRVGQMQAAIAEAVGIFGHIDVLLLCRSEALIGTIEELTATVRTRSLIEDLFEVNFFATVGIIKAVLPVMRERENGHIVVLTGITAHLGTPGLGMHCASQWALEGYCDSLAYEIAPFNIKLTIVQPNMEIGVFTNKLTAVPPMAEYTPDENHAPLAREIFSRVLDTVSNEDNNYSQQLHSNKITSLYPSLPSEVESRLVLETVFALASVGGHENPPARLIVGFEGIASVKEKLKTISEELEDFYEVSEQVDLPRPTDGSKTEDEHKQRDGRKDQSDQDDNEALPEDPRDFDLDMN